ncbi:MAG: acyltransferase family protein [Chloroflexota bacterium]
MSSSERIYFLDNLRAFVILLVVVLHSSMTYMAYAPSWWYVVDTNTSLFFTMLVLVIDVPVMLIMFFVAGYFALLSLAKKGPGKFLQDKFVRVGTPWLVGVLLLAPPTAYMIYFSRRVPVGLVEFCRRDFWGEMYQQSVYWFLGILFLFFVILSLIYALSGRLRSLRPTVSLPSWKPFLIFGALMTAGFLLMNQFFPLDAWSRAGYLFVYQPLRAPLYLGYFVLGLYAYQQGWFTANGYRPRLMPWASLCVGSGLLYLGYRLTIPTPAQTALMLKAGNAILFNTFCLSALITGAALFQRKVNGPGFFWQTQAANSYGIYYVHPLILYPLAYVFVGLSLPIFLKAPLLIILAILLSWAVSALILKKAPVLRRVF